MNEQNEPPSPFARALALDALRGVAVLLVLVFHTDVHPELHSLLYWPLVLFHRVGWAGVDLFFVLSGYLVGGLLLREHAATGTLDVRRFWARRALKVWPTYYAFLATYAVAVIAFGHDAKALGDRAALFGRALLPNLLNVQNYFGSPVIWLWSLAVEEHFYLVLPGALLAVLRDTDPRARDRRMLTLVAGAVVVCTALRALTFTVSDPVWRDATRLYFPTHLRLDSLAGGVGLAYLAHAHDGLLQRLRPWRAAIVVASLAAWTPFYLAPERRQAVLYPVGFVLLMVSSVGLVLVAHLAATSRASSCALFRVLGRALGWLGVRSYAIYVWHGYFAKPLAHRAVLALGLTNGSPGLGGWVHDLVYLASYVALGAVMYALVERPGLTLRRRLVPPTIATRLA